MSTKIRMRSAMERPLPVRVHRLKDGLHVILALRERNAHGLRALDAVPEHVRVVDNAQLHTKEREVVNDSADSFTTSTSEFSKQPMAEQAVISSPYERIRQ